ncbi:pyridoxamine 5'-phosphate oxidase family protein [Streptomyces sp. NPDC093111]|uniref:pyridoxamine 5'-phosphate oxidase family protein n=1 Tax=Streptomyces sp. NPDC093111 TaxID=3154978 RepID=UPI00343316E4
MDIDEPECWVLLDDHGVDRVAVVTDDGPVIHSFNYQVVGREVLFMTAAGTPLAKAAGLGLTITFEQDHVGTAFSQGWSVLLVGPVRRVSDPATARSLSELACSTPWAGDGRDVLVVFAPNRVTGRRIRVEGAPGTEPGAGLDSR